MSALEHSPEPALPGCHLVTMEVEGRPASFATAAEQAWKVAVRQAVVDSGVQPSDGRFAVQICFRTAAPQNANEVWDLDNLVKPTLDALEGVFGLRPWKGIPQPADDRVDHLVATKVSVAPGQHPGATITIHQI